MIYITDDDLITESYERFITESTSDFNGVKDNAELKSIGIAKTLLKGRYDVESIFNTDSPIRDEYLADIITKLTLYKIFRRNAARKVPTDLTEDYNWAMKQLQQINAARLTLSLPAATSESGESVSDTMWGNNKNENYYI